MKNKILTVSVSISLLIVAFSVAYYLIYYLPKKQNTEMNINIEYKQKQQELLSNCLAEIESWYQERWDRRCKNLNKGENCALSSEDVSFLNVWTEGKKGDCFKQYPQD